MWSFASFLIFCLCASAQIVELDEYEWLKGRYEDKEPTQLRYIEVFERNRFGIYGSSRFDLFERDEDVYLGFSMNFDDITHNIDSYLLQWDLEDEEFQEVDQPVQPRPTSSGLEETQTAIYYFNTADGETWAYHAFIHVDNSTERSTAPVAITGESLIYQFDSGANQFSDTASYSQRTTIASDRAYYFAAPDGREFLWTASTAEPYTRNGFPNCTYLEYKEGNWGVSYFNAFNCTKVPTGPLVFTNVKSEWMYLDAAKATVTFNAAGVQASITTTAVPSVFYTWRDNGLVWADAIDKITFTDLDSVYHFESRGYDYLVGLTASGVTTYRLLWETHTATATIPFLRTGQANPKHLSFFSVWGHTCISLSYAGYSGRTETTIIAYEDAYFPLYCWDDVHDNWDLVLKIPARGVVRTFSFMSDDRQFLVAISNVDHLQGHTVNVYEIEEWYEDETIIMREAEPSSYEMAVQLQQMHDVLDDLHHYKAIIIATISILALVVVLQLVIVMKGF